MIELAEEEKILPPGQPGIETRIASSVIAESAPDRARIFCRVVAGDKRLPACGQKKRCQNSQNRRFSGAIRAQKRDSFAFRDFESLGDLNAGHPDDRAVPDQQGDRVADASVDSTINDVGGDDKNRPGAIV